MKQAFFLIIFSFFFACNKKPSSSGVSKPLEISFIKQGELSFFEGKKELQKIDIELAQSEEKREQGLMFRSSLEENQGMLFIFEDLKIRQFWMKNTFINLDIIYIDENLKVINISKETPAFLEDETQIPASKKPAKYVLEVNGGLCKKWAIKEGTEIRWKKL
jgi:uncharacterized protein